MVDERYLTLEETSQFLKISTSTLKRLIRQNGIPSYKVGHRRLFDKDELVEWVRSCGSEEQGTVGDLKRKEMIDGKRWYDEDEELSSALEKIRMADTSGRDNIFEGIKKIITRKDSELIDKVCTRFHVSPHRERWYDEDLNLWLVVNLLLHADDTMRKKILSLINGNYANNS
jgi:excisionase family DNA binding protein